MFRNKIELRIPGPAPVPPQVLQAAASPMINHRGEQFKHKLPGVLNRLKPIFKTENTILSITGSGTAGMEAAVANTVNPGDPVLVLIGGSFGQRWADICNQYQAKVYELQYPWGEGVDPEAVHDFLQKHPEIKVVFATHNESSTGVLNDIEGIGKAVANSDALLVVDAVSSLGGSYLETDAWEIDIVCTASQKCLLTPPGLAFISVSERAKERMKEIKSPRFYFNLLTYEEMLLKGQPPYTPNLSNFFAIEEALDLIEAEGLDNIIARHYLLRDMIRAGIQALGLKLLVEERWASTTVTAVVPEIDNIGDFLKNLYFNYGVELAGGQGKLATTTFRIGHMGYATPLDMLTTLAAIEASLGKFGVATAAAEQVWVEAMNKNR